MSWEKILKAPEIPKDVLSHPMRYGQKPSPSGLLGLEELNTIIRNDPSTFYWGRKLKSMGSGMGARYGGRGDWGNMQQFIILVKPSLQQSTISELRDKGYKVGTFRLTGKDIKEGNVKQALLSRPYQLRLLQEKIPNEELVEESKFTTYSIRQVGEGK